MMTLKNISGENRLFTYKVAYDGGCAPNPFHGVCTLAICKPYIRSVAKSGDVIVGLGCGEDASRIVYCMVVDKSRPWQNYINLCNNPSEKLSLKIPKNGDVRGDCIWENASRYSDAMESWSMHNGKSDFERDVKRGINVLMGETFWYFGIGDKHKILLPDELKDIIPRGQGHRSNANTSFRDQFTEFFNKALANKNIDATGELGTPALVPGESEQQLCNNCRAEERESDKCAEEKS